MVDTRNVEKNYKSLRVFSLPHKPLALNLMIDRQNTILGFDNCGFNYVGKLGEDLKLCLVSFNSNSPTTYLNGRIDLSTKRIIGEWMSDEHMEYAIMEMVSYGSDSQFELIPDHDLECFRNMTCDDLLAQFTAKITNDNCEQISRLLEEECGRSFQLVR